MSRIKTSKRVVRIALMQSRYRGNAETILSTTIERIRKAANEGAHIISTQELFNTPYFCRTQNTEFFNLAESIPGKTSDKLCALARELGVVLIASLFERRGSGLYHNTALVIDADGTYLGKYRKMHIPQDPSFEEKFYFTPGDLGYKVWDTKFGKVSVLICWDQWFPEAARLCALGGAEIIFYPTAIGWLAKEEGEYKESQHAAWETVQRGHAAANACFVATVNRTGNEGDTEFWGQSFVADYFGQIIERAPIAKEYTLFADCDLEAIEEVRCTWPFFRDRRIDSYGGINHRSID